MCLWRSSADTTAQQQIQSVWPMANRYLTSSSCMFVRCLFWQDSMVHTTFQDEWWMMVYFSVCLVLLTLLLLYGTVYHILSVSWKHLPWLLSYHNSGRWRLTRFDMWNDARVHTYMQSHACSILRRYKFNSNSERYRECDSAGTWKQIVLMCRALH